MYMLLGSYGDDMRDDMWMPRRAGTNRRGVSPAQAAVQCWPFGEREVKALLRERMDESEDSMSSGHVVVAIVWIPRCVEMHWTKWWRKDRIPPGRRQARASVRVWWPRIDAKRTTGTQLLSSILRVVKV